MKTYCGSQSLYKTKNSFCYRLATAITLMLALTLGSAAETMAADKKKEETVGPDTDAIQEELVVTYHCSLSVSYVWRPTPEQTRRIQTPGIEKAVYFSAVEAVDSVEVEARKRLSSLSLEETQRALAACQSEHENEALCISSRMKSLGPSYELADFSTRKILLDSLKDDCKRNTGECLEPKVSQMECTRTETKVPAKTQAPTPTGDAKGTADPKKGKK